MKKYEVNLQNASCSSLSFLPNWNFVKSNQNSPKILIRFYKHLTFLIVCNSDRKVLVLPITVFRFWSPQARTGSITANKMKFSMMDLFSKCGQIRKKLWICSHLLKKPLMENFIFVQCIMSFVHRCLASGCCHDSKF